MGALTFLINRKRQYCDQPFTSTRKSQCSSIWNFDYSHISKKHKVSNLLMSGNLDQAISFRSVSSRLHLFPEVIQAIDREVHAPTRFDRFGLSAKKEGSGGDGMRNIFAGNYNVAKSIVFGSLRYFGKGKEVIVIDDDIEGGGQNEVIGVDDDDGDDDEEGGGRSENDVVEGDSSLEVIEVLEDGLEEEQELRKREEEEIAGKYRELDRKVEIEENPSSSRVLDSGSDDGKLLESLSLDKSAEVWDVDNDMPVHKKLYNSVKRSEDKLSGLKSQIEVTERRLEIFQLLHPAKKQEDVPSEAFLPLTEDEETEVAWALSNAARRKVLVTHENSNIQITGELLQCLKPREWLNDEVINVYLELLKERERREPKKYLKCHFFNTFFYKKLIGGRTGYDYKSVRRWTTQRKLGYCLDECDMIFVPVHKEIHWCLAVINKKDGKFQYLDSLGGVDRHVMKVLAQYIVDEVKDKIGKDIDVRSWKKEYVEDLPKQKNGFDCGMYMIKYVDFYSRDIGLCFNQEHMPYFRRRTAKEILRLNAH